MKSTILFKLSLILILGVSGGCKQETTDAPVKGMPNSLEYDHSELLQLKTIKTVLVKENELLGRGDFHVTARTKKIGQFPCRSCHDTAQSERAPGEIDPRSAHLDIQLNHAGESILNCQLCHNYAGLQNLILLNKEPLDFNHSYQLCIQCHFRQGKDWAGGAHGKRLAGWEGKRVVMNCTDCHNPHSPEFDQRWPLQFPTIPRSGTE
jgi:hypothetical protein